VTQRRKRHTGKWRPRPSRAAIPKGLLIGLWTKKLADLWLIQHGYPAGYLELNERLERGEQKAGS
jgi:hypothetical protein